MSKLAEVSTEFLRLVAHRLVADRLDAPMAEVMTQDCTPLRTATMHVGGQGSLRVVRRGRQGRERLVQRVFLVDHAGEKAVVFVDPRDMASKTAASHHVAGVAVWPGARVLGHHRLLISHGCWDRAVKSACARFQAQRHAAWKVHQGVQLGDDEAHHRWLWHWTTSAGCVAHD